VTIPNSVTKIGAYAFAYCEGITAVVIPNSVKVVCIGAFAYCKKLKMAMIPQCICALPSSSTGIISSSYGTQAPTSSGVSRVFGCGSIFESSYVGVSTYPSDPALTNIIVAQGTTYIADSAFADCKYLQSVTIPATVTRIGTEAFKDCSSLNSLVFEGDAPDVGTSILLGTPRRMEVKVKNGSIGWSGGGDVALPNSWCDRVIVYVDGEVYGGGSSGGGGGSQMGVDARYDLSSSQKDRSIASVTIDDDCAIDNFVLKDGKVYDAMLRIVNTAERDVKLTLPTGYTYETFDGTDPLAIPAGSRNILSITRTADDTFLVSRERLKVIQ
jgi:hypothetical protein